MEALFSTEIYYILVCKNLGEYDVVGGRLIEGGRVHY